MAHYSYLPGMAKTELQCLILVTLHLLKRSVFGQLILKSDCTCPGYPLIYECTVIGGQAGTTVWIGNAFICANREISLFHSDYGSPEGAYGECGNIRGKSIKTIDSIRNISSSVRGYVSQLIVSVRPDTIGKNIECQYDDGHTSEPVGQVTISATTGPFPPPEKMYLINADLSSRQLIFKWRAIAPNCPAISYNILASNCGSCPTTTNHTTATCTDVPTNGNSCTFALETVVCGHIVGNKSDVIQAVLKGCSRCTGAIVSASLLAVILSICVAVFTSVIVYLLRDKILNIKEKMNIQSGRSSDHTITTSTSDYEDVRRDRTGRPNSAINTKKNVAYGQGLTVSTTVSQ